jgi:hypothetical protein
MAKDEKENKRLQVEYGRSLHVMVTCGKFLEVHPDYVRTDENYHSLMDRLCQMHLGKKFDMEAEEDTYIELLDKRLFNVDTLTRAWEAK